MKFQHEPNNHHHPPLHALPACLSISTWPAAAARWLAVVREIESTNYEDYVCLANLDKYRAPHGDEEKKKKSFAFH